ncbi:MAG: hypothetical protein J7M30_02140 [Deltaproteobacteria bacterium]|nr:hypothetical protein [Deltaproteobacteria bacterium]
MKTPIWFQKQLDKFKGDPLFEAEGRIFELEEQLAKAKKMDALIAIAKDKTPVCDSVMKCPGRKRDSYSERHAEMSGNPFKYCPFCGRKITWG